MDFGRTNGALPTLMTTLTPLEDGTWLLTEADGKESEYAGLIAAIRQVQKILPLNAPYRIELPPEVKDGDKKKTREVYF